MSTSVTIAQVLSKAYVPAHGRDGYGWRVHKQITWFRQPQKHTKYELVHANINIMLFWYRSQAKPDISSRKPTPPPPSLTLLRKTLCISYVCVQPMGISTKQWRGRCACRDRKERRFRHKRRQRQSFASAISRIMLETWETSSNLSAATWPHVSCQWGRCSWA